MAKSKKAPLVNRNKTVLVRELVATQIEYLDLKPGEVASALGYENSSIISMLKNGSMPLPMNKVRAAANVLRLDPLFLARCVDAEGGFGLIETIETVAGRIALTENEERLIRTLRDFNRGMDIDMDKYPGQLNAMCREYGAVAEIERSMHDTTLFGLASKNSHNAVQAGIDRANREEKEALERLAREAAEKEAAKGAEPDTP